MPAMKDCMTDLETLGTRAGCTILSIGAVMFDPETKMLGARFYVVINRYSCKQCGLFEDTDTLKWWEEQSPSARKVLTLSDSNSSEPLETALTSFKHFLSNHGAENVRVWGNGADFDNAILQSAWAACMRTPLPWEFWNNRCYRTLKGFLSRVKITRIGTHHNALDDAIDQAVHAMVIMEKLGLSRRNTFWQRLAFAWHSLWR